MNIFLVEDSPEILNRLRALIGEIGGLDVVGQANGQEMAVKGIFGLSPDIVILDLSLAGGGSGVEVLRQVKKIRPRMVVIVFTNHAYPQYREKCRRLGCDYFLDKSRDFKKLERLLAGMAGSCAQDEKDWV